MKKLLILGANPETASIVLIARKMGVTTYVVDLVDNSPAKRVCDYAFNGNAADVNLLSKIIIDNNKPTIPAQNPKNKYKEPMSL